MFVKDWGIWEDTFNFVKNLDKNYIQKNLTLDVFLNINMDLMAFFNQNGKLIYCVIHNKDSKSVIHNTAGIYADILAEGGILSQKTLEKQPFSGFMRLNNSGTLLIVTSHPIFKNINDQEYGGALMIVGILNTNFIEKLKLLIKQNVELQVYSGGDTQQIKITALDDAHQQASLMINDLKGQPLFRIKITFQRPFNIHAKKTFRFVFVTIITIGTVFFIVLLILTHKFITQRITKIIEQMKEIADKPNICKEIHVETDDEIGELQQAFNSLIKAIQERSEMLEENEKYQRALFNGINVGILIIEPKRHTILFANRIAQELIGLPQEKICWRTCYDFVCTAEKNKCPIVDLHQENNLGERVLLNAKREPIPILKYASIIKWKEQDLIVESIVDIRRQKEAEEAIKLITELEKMTRHISSNFLKASSANLKDVIKDALSKIQSALKVEYAFLFEKYTGLSPEKLYEASLFDAAKIKDIFFYKKLVVELEKSNGMLIYNKDIECKQSSAEFLGLIARNGISSFVAIPLEYRGGVFGVFGLCSFSVTRGWKDTEINILNVLSEVFSNALQRLHIEEELKNSEERYRKVFHNSAAPAVLVNKDGTIELANNAFIKMIGREISEVLRHNIKNFFEPKDVPLLLLDTEETATHPVSFSALKGTRHLLAMHSTIPETNSIIISFVDLTERYLMEEKLKEARLLAEEASQMKTNFLANISHEIRTPLTSIVGFADLINTASSLAEAKQNARDILRESENLLALITDILDTSKIEAGKMALAVMPFSLRNLINEIEPAIRIRAESKKLDFVIVYDENIPPVINGDPIRLRQILMNLLTNAVKFTEKGKVTLAISLLKKENSICLIKYNISDTGIGIPHDKQKDIFSPFYQADTSIKRKYGGSGLGVYLANYFVEMMGGKLQLESKVGSGTTFCFELQFPYLEQPIDTLAGATPQQSTQTRSQVLTHLKAKPLVLIVEDYPPNQEVLRRELEQIGAVPHIASNGMQALSMVASHIFDIIFMDLQMPEMSGYDVASQIRCGNSPNTTTPIIALTADAHSYIFEKIKAAGMNDVIHKPVRLHELSNILFKWVRNYSSIIPAEGTIQQDHNDAKVQQKECKILDVDRMVKEFAGNKSLFKELLTAFASTLKIQLDEMQRLLAAGNIERIRKEAHKIRGGASNLSAQFIAEKAAQIEKYCSQEEPDKEKIASLLAELELEHIRFIDNLKTIR